MTANKARQDRQRAYVPLYTYTHTLVPLPLYPWHPMPTTYIHACIDAFVYLIVFVLVFIFVYLIVFVSLTLLFSLVLSSLALSLPLGKACPWAGAAGFICLVCANVLFYLIIIQQCTCMVWYVCISTYCIVYVYVSSIIHVSNRCMYAHSVVCIVLCVRGLVYV